MNNKGFTLIELLIVITIIAILAGAAIPYVQQYVEDARYAKAKQDMEEIRNALVRFETDRGKIYPGGANGVITQLVGPYLNQAMADPWGGAYVIDNDASRIYAPGPDGVAKNDDDVTADFRPPLALSKAYWEDTDKNGSVNDGDALVFKFTRPTDKGWVDGGSAPDPTDFTHSGGCVLADVSIPAVGGWSVDGRQARLTLTTITTPFVPGKDTIDFTDPAGKAKIIDGAGNQVKTGCAVPIKAR